jgi:deoxyribodipyrimidine photolyase-related protein
MLETRKLFLEAIASLPPKLPTQALFILHDQLNLSVFPPELLAQKPLLIFVESLAYATAIPHHKQKIVYILSSQRHFAIACQHQGFIVLPLFTEGNYSDGILKFISQNPDISLTYMMPLEWDTKLQMADIKAKFPDRVRAIANNFLIADTTKYTPKIKKGYRLEAFYRDLRQSTGYLMDGKKPVGGSWNYDKDNRKNLPAKVKIPAMSRLEPNAITQEVISLVENYLPQNFGTIAPFNYAVTREQALILAEKFMEERLPNFGAYEDAMKLNEPFLFHSVLSVYLNNGLLLARELCEMAIAAYDRKAAPLNSVEGFLRQILGWREFIHIYYEAMMPAVRDANHFKFTLDLPQLYWDADTDLLCLKDAASNVIDRAYSHHIQRLMVLSNFSNLTFTNPQALNHWFHFAYIDAYEWVELPNILGMSTFADGGILASKPYVSGGNYINKMSNYCAQCKYDVKQKTGDRACPFNYLYWNFVDTHRQDFMENGRVSLMTGMFDRKSDSEKAEIRTSSQLFMDELKRHDSSPTM